MKIIEKIVKKPKDIHWNRPLVPSIPSIPNISEIQSYYTDDGTDIE